MASPSERNAWVSKGAQVANDHVHCRHAADPFQKGQPDFWHTWFGLSADHGEMSASGSLAEGVRRMDVSQRQQELRVRSPAKKALFMKPLL